MGNSERGLECTIVHVSRDRSVVYSWKGMICGFVLLYGRVSRFGRGPNVPKLRWSVRRVFGITKWMIVGLCGVTCGYEWLLVDCGSRTMGGWFSHSLGVSNLFHLTIFPNTFCNFFSGRIAGGCSLTTCFDSGYKTWLVTGTQVEQFTFNSGNTILSI